MKLLSFSFRFARIRGVELRFHFSMLFCIPIAYYLFRPSNAMEVVTAFLWLTGFVLSIFLHEAGHALTAQLVGVEVKSIVIWLLGGFTNLSRRPEKPSHTLVISAAGPLVNMLLTFLCVALYIIYTLYFSFATPTAGSYLWAQAFSRLFFSLALFNLILIVFNLLPIYLLDGGNIVHSAMEMLFGKSNADRITLWISLPVLLALIAFGLAMRDYLLLASCVLIGLAVGSLNRSFLRALNLGINYLFKRSAYYYLQEDYERAIQSYTRDIDKEPRQPNHYIARAACLLNIRQRERAKADLERAINLDPNNLLALQLRGEMYAVDKDFDRAMEFFNRTLEINPAWGLSNFDLGSILLDKKEFQPALDEFNKAVLLLPQVWLLYLIRSIAHFRLGNFDLARKDQDQALRLSEKESLVMTESNMSVYKDCLDWAEDYYARILLEQPRSGYAHQGRADAYRVNDEHQKAIADYTRAIEFMPKEARLYLGRGRSYLAFNETEKATVDFQKVVLIADKLHLKHQAEELLSKMTATYKPEIT